MRIGKKLAAAAVVMAVLSAAGIAGATVNNMIRTRGAGPNAAVLSCPGGMSRLGHELNEDSSIFPGDPAVDVETVYTVDPDGFRVERILTGTHAGTHLDVPSHFLGNDEGRTLDDFAAEEFVWPAYKIDVRGMDFTDNFINQEDIEKYEDEHGKIKKGSLVILQTGAEEFFGLGGDDDVYGTEPLVDENGDEILDDFGNTIILSANTDDLFAFENAGFSGDAVQWMFDFREIDGVGSDAYGPDAATDEFFDATYITLLNDGVALVAIANLDSVSVRGDVIMAPTVSLSDGSGFSTDPIACHGGSNNGQGHGNDKKD